MSKEPYTVELFYGWQETEDGTFHAFEAIDPQEVTPKKLASTSESLGAMLADLLSTTPDDRRFQCKHMPIRLPGTLVERIKHDAICEYLASQSG